MWLQCSQVPYRAGYTARIRRHADIPPPDMAQAVRLADAWRDTEAERGFSMALGRLGDPADPELVVARARNADGTLVAVLTFVPWGTDGLSLDALSKTVNALQDVQVDKFRILLTMVPPMAPPGSLTKSHPIVR